MYIQAIFNSWEYSRRLSVGWSLEVRAGDFYFQLLGVLPLPICGVVVGSTGRRFLFSILRGTSVTYLWGGRWKYGQEIVIFNSWGYFHYLSSGWLSEVRVNACNFKTCTCIVFSPQKNLHPLMQVFSILIKFYSSSPRGPS